MRRAETRAAGCTHSEEGERVKGADERAGHAQSNRDETRLFAAKGWEKPRTMGVFDFESARQYVLDSPRLYRQWWLNLVHEDPGHVVVETALIAFIVYILLFKRTLNPKVRLNFLCVGFLRWRGPDALRSMRALWARALHPTPSYPNSSCFSLSFLSLSHLCLGVLSSCRQLVNSPFSLGRVFGGGKDVQQLGSCLRQNR